MSMEWRKHREKVFEKLYRTVAKMLVEEVEKRRGIVLILDVGCGDGKLYEYFVKEYPKYRRVEYIGVDADEVACRKAADKGVFVFYKKFEDFVNEVGVKFDIVVLLNLLEELDVVDTLVKLKRIVDEESVVIATMTNSENFCIRYIKRKGWRRVKDMTISEFQDALEKAGYEIVDWKMVCYAMPLSLKKNYKWIILPSWLCRVINLFDKYHEKGCIFMIAKVKIK